MSDERFEPKFEGSQPKVDVRESAKDEAQKGMEAFVAKYKAVSHEIKSGVRRSGITEEFWLGGKCLSSQS